MRSFVLQPAMNPKPSYAGQGKPLPASMGKGQWIIENLASLSIEDVNLGTLPAEVLSGLEPGYVGFKVAEVAVAMGITVEELFRANEIGELRLENKPIKSKDGFHEGLLFRLSFGERYCVAQAAAPQLSHPSAQANGLR
jgi:hypothetical protein